MTITEAAENMENNIETVFTRLNHADRQNRIMRKSLDGIMVRLNQAERNNRIFITELNYIHEQLEIHRARAIQNVLYRIEKALEAK